MYKDDVILCYVYMEVRLGNNKTGLSPPVFLYWPFQGDTSVAVPYCYFFLLSVFIL